MEWTEVSSDERVTTWLRDITPLGEVSLSSLHNMCEAEFFIAEAMGYPIWFGTQKEGAAPSQDDSLIRGLYIKHPATDDLKEFNRRVLRNQQVREQIK